MEEEYVDVLNENLMVSGTSTRARAHREGLLHRTFHCWVVGKQSIYFQLRGHNVAFPDMLDVTAGGHVKAGESDSVASRELKEETGLSVDFANLLYLGRHMFSYSDSNSRIREVAGVYITGIDGGLDAFRPSGEELSGIVSILFKDGDVIFGGGNAAIRADAIVFKSGILEHKTVEISEQSFVPGNRNYFKSIFHAAQRFSAGNRNIQFSETLTG